jgi:hypothetical protein
MNKVVFLNEDSSKTSNAGSTLCVDLTSFNEATYCSAVFCLPVLFCALFDIRLPIYRRQLRAGYSSCVAVTGGVGGCNHSFGDFTAVRYVTQQVAGCRYGDCLSTGRSGVRISAEVRDFYLLQTIQTGYGAHPVNYSVGTGRLFSAVKRP